jgi:hypothetical protein
MPYAERDDQGRLRALHREPRPGATERLPADAPEVQAFLGTPAAPYERLDAEFIRVLEDLIDVLLARGVINVTDLPQQAQRKLLARKGRRAATPLAALDLLGEGSGEGG